MLGWYPPSPDRIGGGPEQNTYIQVQTLSERPDVDVCVVSRLAGERGNKLVRRGNTDIHFVGQPSFRFVPNTFGMARKIAAELRTLDYDIAISHNFTETLAALRVGRPCIYIVHGISAHEAPHARGLERLRYWLQVKADIKAIQGVSDVVCISDYSMRYVHQYTQSRIHTISYPAVEDAFFNVPAYEGGQFILYVGTINALKNVSALVRAMPSVLREHPYARLRICGKTDDEHYRKGILNFLAEHKIRDRVDLPGVVSRDTIRDYLRDSACLVLCSRQENTPNAVAQAMSAGRAVVAAPVGGVPEMVEEGVSGYLVPPDDVDTLAARVSAFLADPSLARNMGDAGRRVARRRFDRNVQVDQVLSICREVLSR